jgi:hypothetical protein
MPRDMLIDCPEKFKFWDASRNPGADPSKITANSGKCYNLRCPDCDHLFPRKLHGLTGCKFCTNQERCTNLTCEMCFNSSLASRIFATLEVFLFYVILTRHPSFRSIIRALLLMNPACAIPVGIDVRQVAKSNSKQLLRFMCRKCWHVFECHASRVCDLKFCPFCSPVPKQLCPESADCTKCFEKSFASHSKACCWDFRPGKNFGKKPCDVFKSGTHLADLICEDCGHEFQATCNNVSTGYWCPYCSGQRRCPGRDCASCNNKKLSSLPAAVANWNAELNGDVTPHDVALTNGRDKWWFNCENGKHPPYPRDAVHIRRGQMCSDCSSPHKTERIVCAFIRERHHCVREFAPLWCRNGRLNSFPRFDIHLPSYRILVEVDGQQHFELKYKKWGCPVERRNADVWKMAKSAENSFSGIRIYQPDVYENRVDWKDWLIRAIKFVREQSSPCWVFPTSSLYDDHVRECSSQGVWVHRME